MKPLTTALTLIALAAAPLAAQQHRHGQQGAAADTTPAQAGGMGMQMGMGGMMGMMEALPPQPAQLLEHADHLGLDVDQRAALEALRDGLALEKQAHQQACHAAHQQAADALAADEPDLEAYRTALTGASAHMVEMRVTMARAGLAARALLTPEQREQAEGLPMSMGGGMGMGGMGEGGMGKGGHGGHRPGGGA